MRYRERKRSVARRRTTTLDVFKFAPPPHIKKAAYVELQHWMYLNDTTHLIATQIKPVELQHWMYLN